ncbi:MAG: oligosaccharide flippase family protein [Alphaproteobacteria bacterium]|nr:oligosaccharide flippase family protein [Alphaproteobacteria bacterium]
MARPYAAHETGNSKAHRMIRQFFMNVGAMVFARAFLAASQILVLPIIARNVAITDFAIMALAMSVVIFSSVLSDAGLGRSLIKTEYEPQEWSCVFWFLLGVGSILMLLVMGLAHLWAAYFEQPKLIPVLMALSLVPFCQAISAVPNAELERREAYPAIALVQMTATVIGLGVAIVMALTGFGIWALVAQQVLLAGVRLIGMAVMTRFHPQAVFQWPLVAKHFTFARDALAVSGIYVVRSQVAVLTLGKIQGETALGIFSMSERFARLPHFGLAGPASGVVYVRMAKVNDQPQRLADLYLASMRLLAVALLPPLAMLAVAGQSIFTFLLGNDWAAVAPIFALSIPGMALDAIASVCLACVFRATSRTDLNVRLAAEGAILRVVLVGLAVFISLEAVAASITIWALIMIPRGWLVAQQCIPLSLNRCVSAIAVPLMISVVFAILHLVLVATLPMSQLAEIVLAALAAVVAVGAAAILSRDELRNDLLQFGY